MAWRCALSMDDFRSTWGLGNAPFAMAAYVTWTGDKELYKRSYTYRLREIMERPAALQHDVYLDRHDMSFPMVPV